MAIDRNPTHHFVHLQMNWLPLFKRIPFSVLSKMTFKFLATTNPELPVGLVDSSLGTASQLSLCLCTVLPSSLIFHTCWSWSHSLINNLLANLHLRVWFSGSTAVDLSHHAILLPCDPSKQNWQLSVYWIYSHLSILLCTIFIHHMSNL